MELLIVCSYHCCSETRSSCRRLERREVGARVYSIKVTSFLWWWLLTLSLYLAPVSSYAFTLLSWLQTDMQRFDIGGGKKKSKSRPQADAGLLTDFKQV